jgi:ribose transport system ATP-binding protein
VQIRPLLQAEALGKSFGPVAVLVDINLTLAAGEVHAVIGENGAGKSTLMKLFSGHEQPSAGRMLLDGKAVHFATPNDAERHGIALIHQEQLLAAQLTVAENIFLGRELRRGPLLDRARMRRIATERLAELNCHVDPDTAVSDLRLADRQMVQIARALLVPRRVVIFDEPTAVLTPVEVATLFAVIARLKAAGTGILYISHRLGEVKAVADRVTVLRDGRLVTSADAASLTQLDMARLMVGRDMSALFPPKPPAPDGAPLLSVQHASVPGYVTEASFSLRRGEILGFAGLIGAGRTELFEGLLGLRPARVAAMQLDGRAQRFHGVHDATNAGLAYLTEDRKSKGLLLGQPLAPNLTLMALWRFCRGPFIVRAREEAALDRAIVEFDVRVPSRGMLAGQLSGGNQQKLLLAKTMTVEPRILIIDEPTRGIDIGTKGQIYRFITALAAAGLGCVVVSSEMQELIGLCHRILVMRAGRIVAELRGEDMTENEIVVHATGAAGAAERAEETAA